MDLTHCLFTWHERGDIAYCLSQVGPGGQRRSECGTFVRARIDLCVGSVISRRRFHVGAAGVCDRFHHLDGSVLMNILIISRSARACWVSSSAFPKDKYGRGAAEVGKHSSGVWIPIGDVFWLSGNQIEAFVGAFAILLQDLITQTFLCLVVFAASC